MRDDLIPWLSKNIFMFLFLGSARWIAPCRWCAWERSATSPGCSSCVMTWSPWKRWCMRLRATWASHSRSCSSSATSTNSTCWWRTWALPVFSLPFFGSLATYIFLFVGLKMCGLRITFSQICKFSKQTLPSLLLSAHVAASISSKLPAS